MTLFTHINAIIKVTLRIQNMKSAEMQFESKFIKLAKCDIYIYLPREVVKEVKIIGHTYSFLSLKLFYIVTKVQLDTW